MHVIRFKEQILSRVFSGRVHSGHPHISGKFVTCAKFTEDEQHIIYVNTTGHRPCRLRHATIQGTRTQMSSDKVLTASPSQQCQ